MFPVIIHVLARMDTKVIRSMVAWISMNVYIHKHADLVQFAITWTVVSIVNVRMDLKVTHDLSVAVIWTNVHDRLAVGMHNAVIVREVFNACAQKVLSEMQ